MTWVDLPIPTDEGPLTPAQREVTRLTDGDTCKVRTADGEELEATCRQRDGFAFVDEDDEALDVVAVFMRARSGSTGRSLTDAERKANGQDRLRVWLPSELLARVDAQTARGRGNRTAIVTAALELWLSGAK